MNQEEHFITLPDPNNSNIDFSANLHSQIIITLTDPKWKDPTLVVIENEVNTQVIKCQGGQVRYNLARKGKYKMYISYQATEEKGMFAMILNKFSSSLSSQEQ